MRINKYLALCGVGSRRSSERLIVEGAVKINGTLAVLSSEINPEADTVTVSGKVVQPPKRFVYIMLHKPKGCVTTVSDDKGRKTVFDYVKTVNVRLFPIGRLDYDTEGLLLLTNDGDLANKLMHPGNQIGKTYVAKIEGEIKAAELEQLRNGIDIGDKTPTAPAKASILETAANFSRLEITVFEGRNRQIKRMFESLGKTVVFLKRTKIGELRLGGLARGEFRYLSDKEQRYLKTL